jgi:ribosomal protein L35
MKRLRVTRRGKIVARTPGHNHFNAKESGRGHMHRNRLHNLAVNNQDKSRFLSN